MVDRKGNQEHEPALEDKGPRAGEMLRAARMDRGMSCADVAAALHLDVRTVEALEKEDAADLPPATFTRGYYRSYARLMELDGDAVVQAHSRRSRGSVEPPVLKVRRPVQTSPELSRGLVVAFVALFVLAGAGGGGYWYYENVYLVDRVVPPAASVPDTETPTAEGDSSPGLEEPAAMPEADAEAAWEALEDETSVASPNDDSAVMEPPAEPPLAGEPGIEDEPAPDPETAFTDELAGPAIGDQPSEPAPDESMAMEEDSVEGDTMDSETDVAADGTVDTDSSTAADETGASPALNGDALVLDFTGSSWIEVYDDAGERLLYGLIQEEGRQTVQGLPPFTVVIGDADNVSLEYRGEPVDLGQRRPGRVARVQVPR